MAAPREGRIAGCATLESTISLSTTRIRQLRAQVGSVKKRKSVLEVWNILTKDRFKNHFKKKSVLRARIIKI